MSDGIIDIVDFNKIEKAIDRAFEKLVEHFEEAQLDQLTSKKWEWEGYTKRSNGRVVGSPRDIVDTGKLMSSLRTRIEDKNFVRYFYNVDYSGLVHEGATLSNGTVYQGRPWVKSDNGDSATDEAELLKTFEQFLKEELSNV